MSPRAESSIDEKTKIRLFPVLAAFVSLATIVVPITYWIAAVSFTATAAEAYNVKQDVEMEKRNLKQDVEIEELKKLATLINNNLIEMKAIMKERR